MNNQIAAQTGKKSIFETILTFNIFKTFITILYLRGEH